VETDIKLRKKIRKGLCKLMSQGCSIEIRTQIRGKMCVLVVFIKTNQSGIAQALNKNVLAI
jgi:hypothetical protein